MNHNKREQFIEPVSNRFRKLTEANNSLEEIESLDELRLHLMDLAKEVTAADLIMGYKYIIWVEQEAGTFTPVDAF